MEARASNPKNNDGHFMTATIAPPMKLLIALFSVTLTAQVTTPAPTRLPINAIATQPGAAPRIFVVLATGETVFAELASTSTGQLVIIKDPLTGKYTVNVEAISVTIAPKIVIGQNLPIVNGSPQLVSASGSITAPVIYRNGLRLSEHRDYELDPILGAASFIVRLLPKVTPLDPADVWICDYLG